MSHLRATVPYSGHIQVEIACRRCHERFMPTSEAIRSGVWQICPACQTAGREDALTAAREAVRAMRAELAEEDADDASSGAAGV